MHKLEITLTDALVEKLNHMAAKLNVSPEELAVSSLEEKLNSIDENFENVAKRILSKNAKLYKRLA